MRGALAIFTTAVLSASFVALAGLTFLAPVGVTMAGNAGMATFIWLFGSFFALLPALILGIVVEWPKSIWLARRNENSLVISMLLSVIASLAILAAMSLVSGGWDGKERDDLFGAVAMFSVGGALSALAWWKFMVTPLRTQQA